MLEQCKSRAVMGSLPVSSLTISEFNLLVPEPSSGSLIHNDLRPRQFASVGFARPPAIIVVKNVLSA